MASSAEDIYSVFPARVTVPPGSTQAIFVDVLSGQKAITIKYLSGGTLEILPATLGVSFVPGASTINGTYFIHGSTQTAAMLGALNGTGYLMGTNEILNISGPCRFYLSATGATTLVTTIRGLNAGN